ncbi:hypothetical protein FBU59_003881 [Linderina macrospora]|uniref:Uncharacterized protein n=1 Tax=Linderina macrospora TaxID=4868 RepID=A0ACC1J701_9FUNG|nr:hypothetical protein FBU59_003881 [Linderina macrospora]
MMPRTVRGNGLLIVSSVAIVGLSTAAYSFFANKKPDTTLTRLGFTPIQLHHSQQLTHDVKKLTFKLDSDKKLGNYTSSAVLFRVTLPNGKTELRPYTPVSHELQHGSCEFVVKRYDSGKVSSALHDLGPGDKVEMWGPIPNFTYQPGEYTDIGMIAGGSGLTPMYQLINRVVNDRDDKTRITLVFANKTKDDVFLKDQLDQLAAQHPDKFKVHYVLANTSEDWTGESGYVDKEKIQKYMPSASAKSLIAVCGPPAMMESVCGKKPNIMKQGKLGGILKELGYTNVYKF